MAGTFSFVAGLRKTPNCSQSIKSLNLLVSSGFVRGTKVDFTRYTHFIGLFMICWRYYRPTDDVRYILLRLAWHGVLKLMDEVIPDLYYWQRTNFPPAEKFDRTVRSRGTVRYFQSVYKELLERFSYDLRMFRYVFVICFISQWMKRSKHGLLAFPPKKL